MTLWQNCCLINLMKIWTIYFLVQIFISRQTIIVECIARTWRSLKKENYCARFYMHTKRKYCKTQILYYHRTYWLTSLIWNKVHQFLIVFKRKLIHLRTYSNSLVFNNVIKWFSAMKCMPNKMKREILLMIRDFFIFLTWNYSNSSKPHWD